MGAFEGAVIKEGALHCAIVVVGGAIVRDTTSINRTIASFAKEVFGGVPTVLMAIGPGGEPMYFGDPQLVLRLAQIDPRRIPWQKYNIALRADRVR